MAFHEYPYTDFHEMNLDWVIAKVKELTLAWAQTSADWEELRTFVNDYFANLNVQNEINNKLDELAADGTLATLMAPYVASGLPAVVADQIAAVVANQIGAVVAAQLPAKVAEQLPAAVAGEAANWLSTHVDPETGYVLDDSLRIAGAAADAKAVGDRITEVKNALNIVESVIGPNEFEWEQGTLDGYGQPYDSTTRIRTKGFVEVNADRFCVILKEGYKFNYAYYNNPEVRGLINLSFIETSSVIDTSKSYYKFIVARTDNGTITPDEAANALFFIQRELSDGMTLDSLNEILYRNRVLGSDDDDWQSGNITGVGGYTSYVTLADGKRISLKERYPVIGGVVQIKCEDGANWRLIKFYSDGSIESDKYYHAYGTDPLYTTWQSGDAIVPIASDVLAVSLSVKYANEDDITPDSRPNVTMEIIPMGKLFTMAELNDWMGKKISFLGDSITTFAGADAEVAPDGHLIADGTWTYPGNHCRYPQNNLLTDVNKCYWKILIDKLGMVLGINESWAGSKVSWNGSASTADDNSSVCISSQTRINHLDDNGTPNVILVNAGTNDIIQSVTVGTFNTESPANYTDTQIANLSVATFADAYRAMLIRLLKTYPTSEIVCMLPNFTSSTYYSPQKQDPYLEIIKEACDYFGVKWIDARAFGISIYNLTTYLGDGVHPNANGMAKLAADLIKKFRYDVAL